MPKKPLPERFIQDAVADRLNRKYYRRAPAYIATEAYTKLKRADVLLAFMRAKGRPYVVVVEAKSRTTIHQLKLKDHAGKLRWTGRVVTILLLALLSGTLGYQWYFNAVNTLLLLAVFVLGSAAITAVVKWLELSALQSVSAIEQLGRYPANEQWIAIGEDTFVKPEDYKALLRQCKKNRIGLIVVTVSGKLRIKAEPAPKHTFNNYLAKYGKQRSVLRVIEENPDYGPTPSERKKRRRQSFNILLLLSLTIVLSLIAYDETVAPVVPDPFMEDAFEPDDASNGPAPIQQSPAFDCDGFIVDQRAFIVINGLYSPAVAQERVGRLAAKQFLGFKPVPTDCLNSWPAPGRVALWAGFVYPNRPAARVAAGRLRERLSAAGLPVEEVRILKVRPRNRNRR